MLKSCGKRADRDCVPIKSFFSYLLTKFQSRLYRGMGSNSRRLSSGAGGFTIVGVIVASTVGLIVVAGVSQMFGNMYGTLRQMENRSKQIFLHEFIGSTLRTGCQRTMNNQHTNTAHPQSASCNNRWHIRNGSQFTFKSIKTGDNRLALDLDTEKARLEAEYGLSGDLKFQMDCADPSGTCRCPGMSSTSTNPSNRSCTRNWTLSLISQSEVKGAVVYNKNASWRLRVAYRDRNGSGCSNVPGLITGCNITQVPGGGGTPTTPACITVKDGTGGSKKVSLVGCGSTSGNSNVTGTTALGFDAGGMSVAAQDNTFIGDSAGKATTGGYNTFVGSGAGENNTTGGQNLFIGFQAGNKNTAGTGHTFIGYNAGRDNITPSASLGNSFIGWNAGQKNTTGSMNTLLGYRAGMSNTTNSRSTFIGFMAGEKSTAPKNTFIGTNAGKVTTTGEKNTFVGAGAGLNNTTGKNNTSVGENSLFQNMTGNANTFIGQTSGRNNTTGSFNTFIGKGAGFRNTTANGNTYVGASSGSSNISSTDNTFIGYEAGRNATHGPNTFIGRAAGIRNTSGNGNVIIGYFAGQNSTTSHHNVFIGHVSGQSNTTGGQNSFLGAESGKVNRTGFRNAFFGAGAGWKSQTGSENTFIGTEAGWENLTGNRNTFIGEEAGKANTSGSNNVFIGNNAGNVPGNALTSNHLIIGNSAHPEWIKGEFGTDTLEINNKQVVATSASLSSGQCLSWSGTAWTGAVCGQPSSSRNLKKNIKAWTAFDKALEDILKTPLFTYQYRDKNSHPEKTRRGVISEELPEHLQIKEKGRDSRPDWPSVYGTLWAGVKALSVRLEAFKKEILEKHKAFGDKVSGLASTVQNLKKEISSLGSSFRDFKKTWDQKLKAWDRRLKAVERALGQFGGKQEQAVLKKPRARQQPKKTFETFTTTDLRSALLQNQEQWEELADTKQKLHEALEEISRLKSQLQRHTEQQNATQEILQELQLKIQNP